MMILPIIALAMIVEVNAGGRLLLSEILLALLLPFLFVFGRPRFGPIVKQFVIFAAVWFFGAMVTDAIRQTPLEDVARGWSKIIFFAVNFTSIALIVGGNRQRILTFVFLLFIISAVRLRMDVGGLGSARIYLGLIGDLVMGNCSRPLPCSSPPGWSEARLPVSPAYPFLLSPRW